MASCTKIEHWIQSYIDGEQSDSERVIFEKHINECPRCEALLQDQRSCTADLFETFSICGLGESLSPYVMEHLPEMIDLTENDRDLAMVNKRAKHPRSWRNYLMRAVPVAVGIMLISLGYILKENWPETFVPNAVLGSVTHQTGTAYHIDSQTDAREPSSLMTFAMPGDRFETDSRAQMMITLLGPTDIKLAADTRILIHNDRRISVEKGHVFLDVAKGDRMFRVFTPNGDITVFGTSFDVNVASNSTTVSVVEGEVQVELGDNFVQITPGEQVEVTTDSHHITPRKVVIAAFSKWADSIVADVEALHFFASKIAPTVPDLLVHADKVYGIQPYGKRIDYIELEWEPNPTSSESTGYQVYVFSGDDNKLLFKGAISAETMSNLSTSTARIYNRTSPDARLQFAYVRVVPNYNNGKGEAKFTNFSSYLVQ
ncbi:MAG: FecR domain-containing protein [Candidatus Hydrogenedentota bacterium]